MISKSEKMLKSTKEKKKKLKSRMNIVSYIFFSFSRIHHLESGLAASPLLFQKHALNERRFEEVKNDHGLQDS
jgi:hypothetical protein